MFAMALWMVRACLAGIVIGLLAAPRPGVETRQLLRGIFLALIEELAELLALPGEPVAVPDRIPEPERAAAPV